MRRYGVAMISFRDLNDIGKAIAAMTAVSVLSFCVLMFAPGCGLANQPQVKTALTAARVAAIGILELVDFIEDNGGDSEKVTIARTALREKDYGAALAASYLAVEELRARQVYIPEHIDRALYMVKGAMAAQAFEDVARAMRATVPD